MNELIAFDQQLFGWLNGELTAGWLDAIMPWWRDKLTWVPLYLAAAGWLVWKYRLKGLVLLIWVGLTVGLTDQVSSELIKKSVRRERPCREAALAEPARALVGCGGGYSFPSSHASNHFALATLLALGWGRTWRGAKRKTFWRRSGWLWVWAATIAYGQVYVGVHYPIDVLAGSLLGLLLGWGSYRLYCQLPGKWAEPDFLPAPLPPGGQV